MNYFLEVSKHSRLYFAIVIVCLHCIGPDFKGFFPVIAFFFMSGYFFFYRYEDYASKISFWKENFLKRIYSLLIPYIIWNTLCAIVRYFLDKEQFLQIMDGSLLNLYISKLPINGPLWFLSTLMFLVLLTPFVFLLIKYLGKLTIPLFLIGSLLILYRSFHYGNFVIFSVGAFCGINKIDITKGIMSRIGFLVIIVFTGLSYWLSYIYHISDILSFEYYYYIFASLLLMSIVGLCLTRFKICCPKVLMDSSMYLYVCHMIFYYIVYPPLYNLSLPHGTRLLATPLIIFFSLFSYYLLYRYCPIIIGLLMGKKKLYENLFCSRFKRN